MFKPLDNIMGPHHSRRFGILDKHASLLRAICRESAATKTLLKHSECACVHSCRLIHMPGQAVISGCTRCSVDCTVQLSQPDIVSWLVADNWRWCNTSGIDMERSFVQA